MLTLGLKGLRPEEGLRSIGPGKASGRSQVDSAALAADHRLAPELAAYAGTTLLVQASRFAVNLVAAKLLGPFSYGIWNAVSSVLVYGLSAHGGVLNGMNREVPYHSGRGDAAKVAQVRRVGLAIGLLSAFVAGLVTLGASQLPVWAPAVRAALMATAALLLVQQLYQYLQFALKSSIRFDLVSRLQIALSVAFPLAVIPSTATFGLTGFIASQAAAMAIAAALVARLAPFPFRLEWNWPETFRLARIGLPIMTAGILYALLTTVDRWVVLALLGTVSLGYYSLAILTMGALGVLPSVISEQMYPRMALAFGSEQAYAAVAPLIKRQAVLNVAVVTPVLLVVGLILLPLAPNYLPAFAAGVVPAQVASLSFVFLAISAGFGNFLNTVGKQASYLGAQAIALVLNAALGVVFVEVGWGLTGVALSLVVSYAVYSAVLAFLALRLMNRPAEPSRLA